MKPLTKETVEMTRQGLLSSDWCGFSKRDTVNQLCDLALKGLAPSESAPIAAPKYTLPPADENGKRQRLFYYEEAENAWCPAEGLEVDNIIEVGLFLSDGEVIEIQFKRQDMTDDEFNALPEG